MSKEVTATETNDRDTRLNILLAKLDEVAKLLYEIRKETREVCASQKSTTPHENKGSRKAKRDIPHFATSEGLKTLRERLGLTQDQAAGKIGASLSTWQNWEYNRTSPSAATIRILALLSEGKL